MKYNKIALQLNRLIRKDQHIRKNKDASLYRMQKYDQFSTQQLKKIIATIGWPTIPKVGKEASHNAWLIAQHTDNTKFAQKCLDYMQNNRNDIDTRNIAYLVDKILISQGKKQLYGTKMKTTIDKDGTFHTQPTPVDQPEQLNTRREQVGLEPIEEYITTCEELFKKYNKQK